MENNNREEGDGVILYITYNKETFTTRWRTTTGKRVTGRYFILRTIKKHLQQDGEQQQGRG